MLRSFLLSTLAFLLFACTQNKSSEKPGSNDLVQLENEWTQAMMKRDQATLNRLVAQEFTVTGMKYMDSSSVPRNMWMYNTMNDLKIDSVHFIKTKVSKIDDVGIVRALFYWSGSYDGSRFSDSTFLVDTWLKRNGRWEVVSRIVTDQD